MNRKIGSHKAKSMPPPSSRERGSPTSAEETVAPTERRLLELERLRHAIENRTYRVSGEAIAEKIIDRYLRSR